MGMAKGKGYFDSPYDSSSSCSNRYDRFVEFETAADLKVAVEKLDNQEFKGNNVRCTSDVGVSLISQCPRRRTP